MRTLTLLTLTVVLASCTSGYTPCRGEGYNEIDCRLWEAQRAATLQAQEARRIADSTRQAVELENAQQQARANAQATEQAAYSQGTSTAQAVEASRTAAALQATESYVSSMATSEAIKAGATQAAIDNSRRATEISVSMGATLDAAQVERNRKQQEADLAAFKEFTGSLFSMIAGMAFVVVLVVFAFKASNGLAAWLRNRAATISKGPHDAPILIIDMPKGETRIIDPDRMLGASMNANGQGQPSDWRILEQVTRRDQFVDLWARLSQAQQGANGSVHPQLPANVPAMLAAGQVMLPDVIDLPEVHHTDRLLLGVGANGPISGTRRDIRGLIVAGAPRSGKSTLLQSLALQAARNGWSLYLADPMSNTFVPDLWHRVPGMAYEVAEDAQHLAGLIDVISTEADRRSMLFRESASGGIPPADLEAYNQITSEPLSPMILIADEFNTFSESVIDVFVDLARRAQKWGLMIVLAAHSWRSKDIPRSAAELLQSRVCFRVNSREAARAVLYTSGDASAATHITTPGRALVTLGGPTEQAQMYRIRPDRIIALASGDAIAQPLKPKQLESAQSSTKVDRIRALREEGRSLNEIQREVFGYVGGRAYEEVKAALADITTTESHENE